MCMASSVTRSVVSASTRVHICDCLGQQEEVSPKAIKKQYLHLQISKLNGGTLSEDEIKDFYKITSLNDRTRCACCNCQRQQIHTYPSVKSFTHDFNISSSTIKTEGTTLTDWELLQISPVQISHCNIDEPKEHKPSIASLGALCPKQSPIFCRKTTRSLSTIIPSYSLRTAIPDYGQQSPLTDFKVAPTNKLHLDCTAVEALDIMPAYSNMDINRNNGFLRNGTIMTSTSEKREHLYKILVIGELGTGKTSFIKRYVHQFFSQNYRATIGVDFALKVLQWDANTIVRLQLWDIAGQERFGNMTRVYYKEAVGAFIVFDVTRSGTFDCVSKWKEDLDSKVQLPDGRPIPCILLANKCDQDKQGIVTSTEKMEEYVNENGFAGWFETSAKENINIDEAARALVNKILLNDKLISDDDLTDNDKFNLNKAGESSATEMKSKCSC